VLLIEFLCVFASIFC